MSKATVFVVTYSIVIFILFGVFCFLMSTVNPPPIKIDINSENDTDKINETKPAMASFHLRNMDPSDDLEYGLEKSYNSAPQTFITSFQHLRNLTNMIPSVKYKNPHLVRVYPPLWPPATKTTLTASKSTAVFLKPTVVSTPTKSTHDGNKTGTEPISPTTNIPESPIHRRSINAIEKKLDTDTGSVILKILDDDGQSRIEIKLSPNELFEKKKSRMHRSSLKTDVKFSMVIEGKGKDVDINELPENTEIKIMPNDTVVIANDIHDLVSETLDFTNITYENKTNNTNDSHSIEKKDGFLDFGNKTVDIEDVLYTIENTTINNNITIENISEKTDIVKNTTLIPTQKGNMDFETTKLLKNYNLTQISTTEGFGLKVMFDNVTRSFIETYDVKVSTNKTILNN